MKCHAEMRQVNRIGRSWSRSGPAPDPQPFVAPSLRRFPFASIAPFLALVRQRCSAVFVSDRIHFVLDGLQDPTLARALSRRWAESGFDNGLDLAGQSGWLALRRPTQSTCGAEPAQLTEADVHRAASIARSFAVSWCDRTGRTFRADADLDDLRQHVTRDYRRRAALAVMFGLPAVVLHYTAPHLAGSHAARDLAVPWLFEMLLVGWSCFAAGWPILWHGALGLIHRRPCGDLLTVFVILVSYVPSAVAVMGLAFGVEPWFAADATGTPLFHATALALLIAVTQRWTLHRHAARLAGRTAWTLHGFRHLVAAWLGAAALLGAALGWEWAASFAMLLPPALSLGAVNRWCPGWSTALPVFGFAAFLLLAPQALSLNVQNVHVEIAAGFGLIMTVTFVAGWKGMKAAGRKQ